MAQEIEIKLKISDIKAFRLKLKKLGAHLAGNGSGRVHEWNVLFDTPEGALGKNGQLLRIRTETCAPKSNQPDSTPAQRVLLTFKRPVAEPDPPVHLIQKPDRHKVREELELEVTDAAALAKIFESLGMNGWFRYEKYRTTFRLPPSVQWAKGLLIELDETCIGTFVELEGPPNAIDRAAHALGYSSRDYILQNYLPCTSRTAAAAAKSPATWCSSRLSSCTERNIKNIFKFGHFFLTLNRARLITARVPVEWQHNCSQSAVAKCAGDVLPSHIRWILLR